MLSLRPLVHRVDQLRHASIVEIVPRVAATPREVGRLEAIGAPGPPEVRMVAR